jgi:hypothetical protein
MAIETFKDFKVRKRGCVMMTVDVPEWDNICSIVNTEDVYSPDEDHGIEHDPHVTVLYGFYSFVLPNEVIEILRQFEPPKVLFGSIGIFEDHPDFDIVMINVTSEDLTKMNLSLAKLPNEETFPNYKPHVTIAYVKKGTAKKYEGIQLEIPTELFLDEAIYSMPNGQKISLELHERR